jgi:outer membrane protein OmpA-like peptidoglycan-associated protein
MMAGLMIVFLFLLVCYMARTQGTSQDLLKTRDRADNLEEELKHYKELSETKESEYSKRIEEKDKQKNVLEEMLNAQRIQNREFESEKNEVKNQLEQTEFQLRDLKKQKTEAEKQIEKVKQDSLRYFQTQTAIAKCLKTEFQNDLLTWGASVEPDGTVRFYNPSVLFKQNEDKLTPEGQAMLKEFFVRYIKILYAPEFIEQVGEIRVEGHTSSEWAEGVTEIQRYIWNLDLSQRRAFEILRICLPSIDDPKILEKVKGQATATGHSSSKILRNQDNSENRELSRRVEFKAITRSEKVLREMSSLGPVED